MGNKNMRSLRLSETVSPFGVGAIADIAGESLIAMDTSWWPTISPRLESPRLEQALGGSKLKGAPAVPAFPSNKTIGLQFARFPSWLFCQNCRQMKRLSYKDETGKAPFCKCSGPLVPMRFVGVCESGSHIQDISWSRWAHKQAENEEQDQCKDETSLEFLSSTGGNEGLSGLRIRCRACNANRHLGELSSSGSLKRDGVRCQGRQPWQDQTARTDCESPLQVMQRGATNNHIPDIISALDIPDESPISADLTETVRAHGFFDGLSSDPAGPLAGPMAAKIAEDTGASEAMVLGLAAAGAGEIDLLTAKSGLLDGEWAALQKAFLGTTSNNDPNFVTRPAEFLDECDSKPFRLLGELIEQIVLVDRLREVRAMLGFRRYSAEAAKVRVDLGPKSRSSFFPATESFGEGVFFSISEKKLCEWESKPAVQHRVRVMEGRRQESNIGSRHSEVTPRLVLLHTIAHLIIRRLAFDSGYASASIRERIYASSESPDAQAGILIYTAAGDSIGSLGGLVRQGEPPRLARTLLSSLEDADWCSNDPICSESTGQGMNNLNLAGCHGCVLASETSCEKGNVFLDRALVLGNDQVPGFLQHVLDAARATGLGAG